LTRNGPAAPVGVASKGSALDQSLAQQLSELRAEASGADDPSTTLRPALVEAALWCLAAVAAWVALAWMV
jgi:hypothetical protein